MDQLAKGEHSEKKGAYGQTVMQDNYLLHDIDYFLTKKAGGC